MDTVILAERVQVLEAQFEQLHGRVYALENARSAPRCAVEQQPAAPAPPAPAPQPKPLVVPPREIPVAFTQPTPTLSDRLREQLGGEGWEALVGGSLLNRVGALVLVVGIALFLGYSFAYMNPAGRALTALGVSVALLAGGVLLERTHAYRVFARGLIGGGWAALYVTAYAMYAVPAARVIGNPYAGSCLLLAVAAGMIAHSLRYRVETVTSVAYFAAFAALSVTPWSVLALVGLIPLTASLLFLARRFHWHNMAVFGVVATYGSSFWHGKTGAPLIATQICLLTYWLLFEMFDVLRIRERLNGTIFNWLSPLNAIAFLGLSYRGWVEFEPARLWMAYALGSALYLLSAMARFKAQRSSSETTYAPTITVSAVLGGLAISSRLLGVWLGAALAIEAEALYISGVFLKLPFLRWLGTAGFGFSLARLVGHDIAINAANWTPAAIFQASLLYVNRILRQPNAVFSSVAAALVAAVLAQKLPDRFVGTGWLVLAAILFETGLRQRAMEFRFQAYVLAAAGVIADLFHIGDSGQHLWIPLACGLALVYGIVLRTRASVELAEGERTCLHRIGAVAISALAFCLVWRVSPQEYEAACCCALSVVLFELGLRRIPTALAVCSYGCAALAMILVLATGCEASYFVAALAFYLGQWRATEKKSRMFWSIGGSLMITFALWHQFPGRLLTTAWAIEGLALMITGFPLRERILRIQGLALLLVCIVKVFAYDLQNLETLYRILSFVALGIILLGVSSIYTRFGERVRRYL